ncbi:MAG: hypothetical protein WCW47_03210 [Candidatus Paceibacterota bacterium]|jgi:hypothetical protein
MRKITIIFLALLLLILPFTIAFADSEVSITKNGNTTISSVKVMQIFGTTFAARLYWGEAYIRLSVKTDSKTKFFRGTGEATILKEIAEGDILDIAGILEPGSSALTVIASTVKNSSVQKKQTTFSGKVVSVDLSGRKFVLNAKNVGTITVSIATTTQFIKGNRTLDLEHVKAGDTITKTSGDYNLTTKTLVAESVTTHVNLNDYKPKNYEGKLQEVIGITVPTSIKVSINGVSYVVNISNKTSVLNKNRNLVSLSRFVVGDTIRIYGAIQEVDNPIINADIVRNTSL